MKRKSVFEIPNRKECVMIAKKDDDGYICVELYLGQKTIFDYGRNRDSLWETFSIALKDTLNDDFDEEFFKAKFFAATNFMLS
jgi:hypothetical protein